METKDDFGEMLIAALREAVEHHEGRLPARVDWVGKSGILFRCRRPAIRGHSFGVAPPNQYLDTGPVASLDYSAVRRMAHSLAEEDALGAIPPISVGITDISPEALTAYTTTWDGLHPSGYGGFEWVQLWHRLCRHDRRSFHCALWHQSILCGLAIGTVPRGHSALTLRYMEGRPNGHPLQGHVARIALAAVEYYADGLSLPQLRIENPAPGVEALYRDLGFTLAYREGVVRYLVKDLPHNRS